MELRGICKLYGQPKKPVVALDQVDLRVEAGEIFGLIGYSGAGKSTLLRCVNLLERPTQGEVWVDGQEMTRLNKRELQAARRQIGMIFQHFHLLASATVADNVAFPLRLAHQRGADVTSRVNELLDWVGLSEHAHKYPAQLSGGQKQRVAIARALATRPKILLCDEATSALDPETTRQILDLILRVNRELGVTVVVVTHEMSVVRRVCDHVAVMEAGRIVESGSVVDTFLFPKHELTRKLLAMDDESEANFSAEMAHRQGNWLGERPGRKLRLVFRGDAVYRPILSEVAQQTAGHYSILKGTVDVIKDVPYGRLLVQWFGDETTVAKAIAALEERGCRVDVLEDASGLSAAVSSRPLVNASCQQEAMNVGNGEGGDSG
ncbi:methionine ABC transporter ATP-binding protein [Alicyclobacillus kakegawensis]|uniref:methionine ABC transporter ATP-binding protein n=1 Tax=Alicyclobacillus kakegawensis TaxID=392012 RepID=UPI0009F92908|nr:methionine ABC transporter ATP-binding protein [Alicyclobacillus kakegawensis]